MVSKKKQKKKDFIVVVKILLHYVVECKAVDPVLNERSTLSLRNKLTQT